MIGSGFTSYRASRPASVAKPVSGTLYGRTLTSSFAASPRISYQTTWWAAVKQGGFAGWRQLISRSRAERHLTDTERTVKITEIKSAISSALKSTGGKAVDWGKNFNKILDNAAWHAVDVDAQIRSTFQTMTAEELVALRKACGNNNSLKFLQCKIAERIAEIGVFKDQFQGEFFKSAVLYSKGYLLEGAVQNKQWEKIDKLVESFGNYDLAGKVAAAILSISPWQLLPFAEKHSRKDATTSPAMEEFCRQAFIKITKEKIDFSESTDVELGKFTELFKDDELSHHASACATEIEKRLHAARCNKLALHLEKRFSSMVAPQNISSEDESTVFEDDPFEKLADNVISRVVLDVIAKSNPADVVKLSTLKSEVFDEAWLIETAKAHLQWPNVKSLENAHLIAYLKLPLDNISEQAHAALLTEAKIRAETGFDDCFKVLTKGLESGSCHQLVRAVREFSTLADAIAKLKHAAGLKKGWGALPEHFSEMLVNLAPHNVTRARVLVADLIAHGEQHVADHLSKSIKDVPKSPLAPLTPRDDQFMAGAISIYFPRAGVPHQSDFARPVDRTLGKKLLNLFHDKCLSDATFRRVRTPELGEIPVCKKFVLDQRDPMQAVDGKQVFVSHLPVELDKAREFVKKMNDLKDITEEQILMASRIATQSTANSLIELGLKEKLFPLAPTETGKICPGATGGCMLPLGLCSAENFVMKENGTLTAHVRIFNEHVKDWNGEIVVGNKTDSFQITTIPENTSVSVELTFEIDAAGTITACNMENLTCNWEIA